MESTPNNTFQEIHDLDPRLEEEQREQERRTGIEQYVQQIKETADNLLRDQANRGDVKMLSTALKELRYALKVFSRYRQVRKVSIFGSARLPLDDPSCRQAEEFGRRLAQAQWMVITGAASGIMEAGHRGAGRSSRSAATGRAHQRTPGHHDPLRAIDAASLPGARRRGGLHLTEAHRL